MEKYRSSLGVTITGGLTEEATSWAGAALLAELYRKTGVAAATERGLPKKKAARLVRLEEPNRQMIWTYVDKVKPG